MLVHGDSQWAGSVHLGGFKLRPILQAIPQNTSARTVEFGHILLGAEDLCSFLDNAAQIMDLTLDGCALQEREQGAREVAATLQRNTNIVTLKLCVASSIPRQRKQ